MMTKGLQDKLDSYEIPPMFGLRKGILECPKKRIFFQLAKSGLTSGANMLGEMCLLFLTKYCRRIKEKMKIFKIEGKTTKHCRRIKEKMKMFEIEGNTTKYCRRIKEKVQEKKGKGEDIHRS